MITRRRRVFVTAVLVRISPMPGEISAAASLAVARSHGWRWRRTPVLSLHRVPMTSDLPKIVRIYRCHMRCMMTFGHRDELARLDPVDATASLRRAVSTAIMRSFMPWLIVRRRIGRQEHWTSFQRLSVVITRERRLLSGCVSQAWNVSRSADFVELQEKRHSPITIRAALAAETRLIDQARTAWPIKSL